MAAIARFLIAGILLLILWGFGLIASYQADESRTLLSAIAMLVPGVVWLLVAAFALLAALSLYSPRPEVKINFLSFCRGLESIKGAHPWLYGSILRDDDLHILGYFFAYKRIRYSRLHPGDGYLGHRCLF